ncbi:MAG: hypothetical protein O7C67_17405, partial [Gammaproteobacteria bacterium]|nr:hypothetical protein [Gammaproteobacteria bacterium]
MHTYIGSASTHMHAHSALAFGAMNKPSERQAIVANTGFFHMNCALSGCKVPVFPLFGARSEGTGYLIDA